MNYNQREESANKFWSGLTGPIIPLIFGGGYFMLDAIGAFNCNTIKIYRSSFPYAIQDKTFVAPRKR